MPSEINEREIEIYEAVAKTMKGILKMLERGETSSAVITLKIAITSLEEAAKKLK